jgi:hypothetical protein
VCRLDCDAGEMFDVDGLKPVLPPARRWPRVPLGVIFAEELLKIAGSKVEML